MTAIRKSKIIKQNASCSVSQMNRGHKTSLLLQSSDGFSDIRKLDPINAAEGRMSGNSNK